ncbi:hypothetical protein GUJ93_ZPchr0006g43876 [Zizania palustris]|uniref:Uncharacterized protein n=1 Tax=Zizania palustris TaxID=103762 RepID=A0A8J5W4M5_ZIZPA|nr:hypothetical protein GUJ93_ZPchr0006g43876 [Zizania palustris]
MLVCGKRGKMEKHARKEGDHGRGKERQKKRVTGKRDLGRRRLVRKLEIKGQRRRSARLVGRWEIPTGGGTDGRAEGGAAEGRGFDSRQHSASGFSPALL